MSRDLGVSAGLLALLLAACGGSEPPTGEPAPPVAGEEAASEGEPELLPSPPEPEPLPAGLAPIAAPWTGDLDGMVERRVIRVLTVHSPVLYFVDRGRELGIVYEMVEAFEAHVNSARGADTVRTHVVVIPVARDELIPKLLAGEGDIAAATLTITPERLERVDFSRPFARDVSEVVVTGPGTSPIASLQELSGRQIHVQLSSSHAEHLRALNQELVAAGRAPVEIVGADELLESGDLLEMVAAGLIPATVADSFMADLWTKVFPDLVVHPRAPLATGAEIAWAFRKQSPQLAAATDAFVRSNRQGSLAGNVLINKYLKTTRWVKNARSEEDLQRFRSMVDLFQKYAAQYDFDWLLMAAQGYQESGLDQSMRSPVGAIGVMQVMPETARSREVGIPEIEDLEKNIHAGIKYNRWVVDTFYDDPQIRPLDRALFAFASYNAGPGRVRSLREEAGRTGLDPNRWFNNVELVAARRIGRETVQYVANIYKYYLAYQLVLREQERRDRARSDAGSPRTRRAGRDA